MPPDLSLEQRLASELHRWRLGCYYDKGPKGGCMADHTTIASGLATALRLVPATEPDPGLRVALGDLAIDFHFYAHDDGTFFECPKPRCRHLRKLLELLELEAEPIAMRFDDEGTLVE